MSSTFRDSLEGLSIGAPVKVRGVQIGQVVSITPSFAPNERVVDIPVVVELTKGSVKGFDESNVTLDQVIQDGLRARLELASLITGQLYVGLNIIPGAPLREAPNPTGYTQIPSLTSLQYGVRETLTTLLADRAEDREGSRSDARAAEHHGRRRGGGADHADYGCGNAAGGEAVRSGWASVQDPRRPAAAARRPQPCGGGRAARDGAAGPDPADGERPDRWAGGAGRTEPGRSAGESRRSCGSSAISSPRCWHKPAPRSPPLRNRVCPACRD